MERWATFDCYGTLVDWNGGIRGELARIFGDDVPTSCSRGITSSNQSSSTRTRLSRIAK